MDERNLDTVLEELMRMYEGSDMAAVASLMDEIREFAKSGEKESVSKAEYDALKADYIARFFGRTEEKPDDEGEGEDDSQEDETDDSEEEEIVFERKGE